MRFLLYALNGDGTNTFLAGDVPLSGVSWTNSLSAPDTLSAKLEPEWLEWGARLVEGKTAIVVVEGYTVLHASIVNQVTKSNDSLSINGVGFSSYPEGQPYRSERAFIQADCGALVQHIWAHVQAYPGCNLGVTVNALTSGVRLGQKPRPALTAEQKRVADAKNLLTQARNAVTAAKKTLTAAKAALTAAKKTKSPTDNLSAQKSVDAATAAVTKAEAVVVVRQKALEAAQKALAAAQTEANKIPEDHKPYVLSWYESQNLAQKFNEVADTGSIDYKMVFRLDPSTGDLFPSLVQDIRLGRRREDVRLRVDENVTAMPEVTRNASERFSEVLLIGAGEGAAALHAMSSHQGTGLGRAKVVVDQSITNRTVLSTRLTRMVDARKGTFSSFSSYGNAQGIQLGDSVYLGAPAGGYSSNESQWVRVTSITVDPQTDVYTFNVVPD